MLSGFGVAVCGVAGELRVLGTVWEVFCGACVAVAIVCGVVPAVGAVGVAGDMPLVGLI